MRYPAVMTRFFTSLWALRPEDHHFISELLLKRDAGEDVTPDEIKAAIEGKTYGSDFSRPKGDTIAVLGLHGTILNRAGMLTVSGFTSPQAFASAIRAAASDPSVREIVLSVDSPGGTVDGTNTAAEAIRDAAKLKPVTAVADGMMASGAYWISSQATKIVVDPTALVGSIGVIATHLDRTKAASDEGVRVTYFRSVEHKALGQPYETLTDEAANDLRVVVESAHQQFVTAVESGRGKPLSEAARTGRVFTGLEAVEAGLADEVGTLQSVLDDISSRQRGGRTRTAASAAGRTEDVDTKPITQALGLPDDAAPEDAVAAIEAIARDRDEARAAERITSERLATGEREDAARDLVQKAGVPDERLLERAIAAATTAESLDAARERVQGLISLAQERHQALSEAATARAELRNAERERLAADLVTEAGLPSVTPDRDRQLLNRATRAAVTADSLDAARTAVTNIIEERRELLASQGLKRKNAPAAGDTSSAKFATDSDLEVRRARAGLGL